MRPDQISDELKLHCTHLYMS